MKYGYYDNENKEYVITRPDTPAPWMNYLGNGQFSSIISNNAGGLIFDRDPGSFRITRYNFNNIPSDRPGRYLYFKDTENGEVWSPTWQPVKAPLDFYETRHGMGYTKIAAKKNDICSEITYFIPQGAQYEVWAVKIKNCSETSKKLKIFSYIEFSSYIAKYDIECDWPRYFFDCRRVGNAIVFNPSADFIEEKRLLSYISTDLPIESYDCERDTFLGRYRDESCPIAVENGFCSNTDINADNACGSFCCTVELKSGEEKQFVFSVGNAENTAEIEEQSRAAADNLLRENQLAELKRFWKTNAECFRADTPDEDMNTMLNIWHPYQCRMTFNWSRFISYYERGLDRGWGFRDSMQDVLGIMHIVPDEAKKRIKTLLSIQYAEGCCRSVYYPGTGESAGGGRSDDQLWSVFSVCTYIKETGDTGFLNEKVPYVDGGEASVWEHLKAGMEFTHRNVGEHNIPLFLRNDWNDSIKKISREKNKAESAFVFFQAAHAAYELIQLFKYLNDTEKLAWAENYYGWCKETAPVLWDGKWFLRGFTDYGEKYGTDSDEFNKIFLNPQSWAVLSRLPSSEQGNSAFDNVEKMLFCDLGVCSHAPASTGIDIKKKWFFGEKAGVRENGGVFFHASTWAIIAETLLNRGEQAYSLYHRELPTVRNDRADQCMVEPYVYASSMIGPAHERYGAGVGSWLSGTASWMYLAATQYILGFRPDYDGVIIDPCVPESWNGFSFKRIYRGIICEVVSPKIPYKGARATNLTVDGESINGTFIPYSMLKGKQTVKIRVYYGDKE